MSKRKKKVKPTIAQMVKATAPYEHKPTQVHQPTKKNLINKAIKRAEQEDK